MMNKDLGFGGPLYVEELKLISATLASIQDKIKTGHGKREFAQIKGSIDSLIELNTQGDDNDGNWVSM